VENDMTATFTSWNEVRKEALGDLVGRQLISGNELMLSKLFLKKGAIVGKHSHPNEQFTCILKGSLIFTLWEEPERTVVVSEGEVLHIPSNLPHSALCLEDAIDLDIFTPVRSDWLQPHGNDYFEK
jgi:quercetin dioxygenase-like cupin family protein